MYIPREVPGWVIPVLSIALFVSWFLAMRSPTGAAIAAVAGIAFWWLSSFKKAREWMGTLVLVAIVAIILALIYWLAGVIGL